MVQCQLSFGALLDAKVYITKKRKLVIIVTQIERERSLEPRNIEQEILRELYRKIGPCESKKLLVGVTGVGAMREITICFEPNRFHQILMHVDRNPLNGIIREDLKKSALLATDRQHLECGMTIIHVNTASRSCTCARIVRAVSAICEYVLRSAKTTEKPESDTDLNEDL